MSVPTFDKLLRPILALAATQPITRVSATTAMIAHFKLSPEDQATKLPSGRVTQIQNRAGWAMTFLTKGGLLAKLAPKTYAAKPAGKEFLARHPNEITVRDLKQISGWEAAWKTERAAKRKQADDGELEPTSATPTDALNGAVDAINAHVRSRVLEAVLAQTPEFFEQLVLDVLLAMGYGGSREDAAEHLGRSDDEGIDGLIHQDALGLDQIMIQAKRYAPDRPIDRKTVQAFIGSLAGQGVSKGVFITTSSYKDRAEEFVKRGSQTKVVLIDGDELLALMMRHHIGVRVERTVELLELDQNYFEDVE